MLNRRSARDAERLFVVEGATLLGEALAAGALVESVFVAPGGAGLPEVTRAWDAGARVFDLAPGVLERVAGTVTPQPVLAVVAAGDVPLDRLAAGAPARPGPVIVCVDVRDPGNLGTVLRSAEASGAAGVVCCDGTVDVYNAKCVRASAGAVFHVPLVVGGAPVTTLEALAAAGRRRVATSVAAGTDYWAADLAAPVALVLGNEAHGLPAELRGAVDETIRIPMEGRTESLNVGMACAVLCFEAARQRRQLVAGAEAPHPAVVA